MCSLVIQEQFKMNFKKNYLKGRENASRVEKHLIYSKGFTFKVSFKL